MINVYNGVLLSHKENEILLFVTIWMDLKYIMLSGISQIKKGKIPADFTYVWNIK